MSQTPVEPRAGAIGAIAFGVLTIAALQVGNGLGGDYEASDVASYLAASHRHLHSVLTGEGCPRVVGVLGLAPWLPVDEPRPRPRTDTLLALAHGDVDRTVDPRLTGAFARRARAAGVPLALFKAIGEAHPLLHRHGDWNQLVARFVRTGLGIAPDEDLLRAVSSDPDHGPDPLPAWSRRRGTAGAVASIASSRVRLRPVATYA